MKNKRLHFITEMFFILITLFIGCKSGREQSVAKQNVFTKFLQHIESTSNFINSTASPAAVNFSDIPFQTGKNILLIDIRLPEDYAKVHIDGSVNVPFSGLIDYFEQSIEPSAFDGIYILSTDGQAAFFATALLRILGYNNVFAVRWGLCSVSIEYAQQHWLANCSNSHAHLLTREPFELPTQRAYPEIISDDTNMISLLRTRSKALLEQPYLTYVIRLDTIADKLDKYYIIHYAKTDEYEAGHLPGAVRYEPRASLSSDQLLATLPPDRDIIVYCHSGNHSSAVVAYLRLLGYRAYSLHYGEQGFMYDKMKELGKPFFHKDMVVNIPLRKSNVPAGGTFPQQQPKMKSGGC